MLTSSSAISAEMLGHATNGLGSTVWSLSDSHNYSRVSSKFPSQVYARIYPICVISIIWWWVSSRSEVFLLRRFRALITYWSGRSEIGPVICWAASSRLVLETIIRARVVSLYPRKSVVEIFVFIGSQDEFRVPICSCMFMSNRFTKPFIVSIFWVIAACWVSRSKCLEN